MAFVSRISRNESSPTSGGASSAGGMLLVLAAAFLWGTSGTAQALAPEGATPVVIGGIRVGVGGAFLAVAAALRGGFVSPRRFLRPAFLVGGIAQAVFNVSYFTGLALTGVAVGTTAAIGSVPIFSGLLGILLNRERAGLRWYIATGIAVTGLVVLLSAGERVNLEPAGLLFALLAGFSYSFFTFLSGRLVASFAPDAVMAVSFLLATCMIAPILPHGSLAWVRVPGGTTTVLYLGLVSSGLAYMFYGRGLRTVMVSHVGTLTLAEPLTGALLGIFFLREAMTAQSVVGIVLIFVGQALLVTRGRRRSGPKGLKSQGV
ncbi:MAG: DMT family transporter [Spirochaetaceae bacterium]